MSPQSLRSPGFKAGERSPQLEAPAVFAPQAEDHLLADKDAGVLLSRLVTVLASMDLVALVCAEIRGAITVASQMRV